MAWSIDTALQDDAIEHFEKTFDGFSIWLKDIPVEIIKNGYKPAANWLIPY